MLTNSVFLLLIPVFCLIYRGPAENPVEQRGKKVLSFSSSPGPVKSQCYTPHYLAYHHNLVGDKHITSFSDRWLSGCPQYSADTKLHKTHKTAPTLGWCPLRGTNNATENKKGDHFLLWRTRGNLFGRGALTQKNK